MKKALLLTAIFGFVLACNFVNAANPGRRDIIATHVAEQLTSSPIATVTGTPDLAGTATAEAPAPTETETPVPTATETATLSPERLRLGTPTWKETFDKVNQNFYQSDDDQKRFAYENGSLVMTAKNANGWMSWSMSYHKPKNFYLEATFRTETCSGADQYGIVFRAPDYNDGYFLGISCDGKYSLRIYSQKGMLIPWTLNPAIHAGPNMVNQIGILAHNDQYSFYANGILLQQIQEPTYLEAGLFGTYIASINTPNFTVRMDEIDLWNQ
ncbi:MAG: hypothetical protein GYA12_05450 [Chloroflexi bacterium]|nr:hypothetical protein [Chloroflexota bacterium]